MMIITKYDIGDLVNWGPWENIRIVGFTISSVSGIVYNVGYHDNDGDYVVAPALEFDLELLASVNEEVEDD